MPDIEDYIKGQIDEGYWRESDLAPIKCEYCDSTNLKDDNYIFDDSQRVEEYDRVCQSCNKIVGNWSYGNWQL